MGVKPWERLASAAESGARPLSLWRRGADVLLKAGDAVLMSSRENASERLLGEAAAGVADGGHVVLGGLGFGFTLRAALDAVAPQVRVTVVELSAAVIAWNRELVGDLAGHPLGDPRVTVVPMDLVRWLRGAGGVDVLLLDVDNGPAGFSAGANKELYTDAGVALCAAALVAGGRFVLWSEGDDPAYLARLRRAGLDATVRRVPARATGHARRVLFEARKP